MHSVPARVAAVAERAPERIAMIDSARSISYGAFWAEAMRFRAALRSHGLQRGDRVAIVLPNRIEAAVAVYGCWLAGGIAVALNAQAKARDFVAWITDCEAKHVVHEPAHTDAIEAINMLPTGMMCWPLDSEHALSPTQTVCNNEDVNEAPSIAIRTAAALTDIRSEQIALILYTSGTTGAPKGVTLSHGNLIANTEAVVAYLHLNENDSMLSILAFYYAYGASVLHTHLITGARIVLAPNLLFPHQLMDTITRERISGFSGVPSTYALLLERVKLADCDLSSLRYLTQAGGAMSRTLTQRLRTAIPHAQLYVMYGQTEATSRLSWLPPERLDDKPGSVGIPVNGVQLRVIREDGSAASIDEVGEICARGPNIMHGYWDNLVATAAVLRDGWLHTGDLGYLDDEGFLFLVGRRSDMIKTGAHRVHPTDIEEAIAELPGVSEVAAVGIDDEMLGQIIKVFVVAPGLPSNSENLIRAHCRERLASYKIPRSIEFVSALPRTASGKIRRAALLEPMSTP